MKLKSIYRRICPALLSILVLGVLPGCVDEADVRVPGTAGDGLFRMSLTVITGATTGSRADHSDDEEERGTVAENYIDFGNKDFRIVIFDNYGKYLFELNTDEGEWTEMKLTASFTGYIWDGEVKFPESLEESEVDKIKNQGFKVLALANWRAFDSSSSYQNLFNVNNTRQTLDQIWEDGTHYNFKYAAATGSTTWQPSHTSSTKRLIPMFGFAQASRFESRNSYMYTVASVPMQRALAKVEIVDNLAQQEVEIQEAVLTDYNTSGRFITDVTNNPDWDVIGSQVGVSSLPETTEQKTGLKLVKMRDEVGRPMWVAYIPEMALEDVPVDPEGNFDLSRTHVDIKVSPNATGYEGGEYALHFAQYDPLTFKPTIPDESWRHILRNHIYRFYVNKINFGPRVDVHLHVIPWTVDAEERWEFTDQIAVTKTLTWTEGTYDSDDDEGNVYLSMDRDKYLTGRFRIMSPVNGKWYAVLTPIGESKADAISFVNADGTICDPSVGDEIRVCFEVSGNITGNEVDAVIRLRPTVYDNDVESRYRLDFYVENLGKWTKVPMVDDGDFDYYTIVRKANLIQL